MNIIIDTREQTPYRFEHYQDVNIETRKLNTGDYSLSGYENIIAIERKTSNDFIQSITRGRGRFEREVKRLALFQNKFIIIESPLSEIINHVQRQRLFSEKAISGTIVSWVMKYNIMFMFAESRHQAEQYVHQIFRLFLKDVKKKDGIDFTVFNNIVENSEGREYLLP